jgi:putative two-component system response regulator
MMSRPDIRTAPILLVDDDESLRQMLALGLTQLGYGVEQAANVTEARALLQQRAYSLVLSDYEMPDGTGMDLLAHISSGYPNLPVVLLTGYDDMPLARDAIACGAADFVTKPFELRQVARVIEQNWVRVERDEERFAALANSILVGTIRALVAAVDAKDPYTARHSERVSRISGLLGEALGYSPERLRILEFAALLHDVGKIGVPHEILAKPGRLLPEEWEIIKQHPERSAEIVAEVEPLAEVATIVRHHHERMDGRGYPDGLSGTSIPEFSRIIALADAYEAMTANRAYRKALTPAEAQEVIRQNLGTQFDVRLGTTFLGLLERQDVAAMLA